MDRDGPGFLADLAVLWGTLTVCLLAANILVDQFGRPWGLVAAVAVGLGVGFAVLVGYYRLFLDGMCLARVLDSRHSVSP
jgi:multisubunit Na+/H+ antiporter MnhB subunit